MTGWVVTVQWTGDPNRIHQLITALLHIQPRPVRGEAAVEVFVRAASGSAAKTYTQQVIARASLQSVAEAVAIRERKR